MTTAIDPEQGQDAARAARRAEVWARLSTVTDPELDESVVALDFVSAVEVSPAGEVAIAFRLPTYWCAANFAYLMADDLRRAAESLPWVGAVHVRLDEHMYGDAINAGLARRASFRDALGDSASDDDPTLSGLRAQFRRKAYQARQETVLRALLARGYTPAALGALSLGALDAVLSDGAEWDRALARYREVRREFGGAAADGDAAFPTPEGAPLRPEGFAAYLRELRGARLNMEFNGALCRGLLAARYGDDAVRTPPTHEPELVPLTTRRAADAVRAAAGV